MGRLSPGCLPHPIPHCASGWMPGAGARFTPSHGVPPPQPHISPLWRWPWDARARCNSARWPVPVCSQTPAPQGLIHHSGPINKTWARPADASPPRGCAAIIYFLIGVEEGFAVVFMALRHGTYGVRVQGVPGRLIFFFVRVGNELACVCACMHAWGGLPGGGGECSAAATNSAASLQEY